MRGSVFKRGRTSRVSAVAGGVVPCLLPVVCESVGAIGTGFCEIALMLPSSV